VFINHVWFDQNVRGFRNAAFYFYQKDVGDLTEDEFISLVAMPVNPKKYNIHTNRQNNQRRLNRIKNMLSGQYIPRGLFDIYYDKI
jgi:membrane peptidoglycan carboxypeptidase